MRVGPNGGKRHAYRCGVCKKPLVLHLRANEVLARVPA
jgi:hypothetical protein